MGRPPKPKQKIEHLYKTDLPEAYRVMFEDSLPFDESAYSEFYYLQPPPNWRFGVNPKSTIERLRNYDNFIESKFPFARRPKRMSNDDDTFYRFRSYVADAAYRASCLAVQQQLFLKNRNYQQKQLGVARKHLSKALAALFSPGALPRHRTPTLIDLGFDHDGSLKKAITKYEDAIVSISNIKAVIEAIDFISGPYFEAVSYSTEPSWRSLFIEKLGLYWYDFTGKMPSSQNRFVEFANLALLAIGAEMGTSESEVRTVIKRVNGVGGKGGRPAWNRFDVFEQWDNDPNQGNPVRIGSGPGPLRLCRKGQTVAAPRKRMSRQPNRERVLTFRPTVIRYSYHRIF